METAVGPEIDPDELAAAVAQLEGRPVQLGSWQVAPIDGQNLGLAGPLFRITGTAESGASWSVILKTLRIIPESFLARIADVDRADVAEAYRWDREADLYASGYLDALPEGFRAERCLASQRAPDSCRLWFEDLGDNKARWDVSRYALAARHLGRFNGTFAGPSAPDAPWLCRGWIRSWVTQGIAARQAGILENDAVWEHELVRSAFEPDARDRLRRVWAARETILARLEALPETFCHMDAFRPNLFDRISNTGEHETVAIDWSYAGIGPIGAEVGQLVIASPAYADPTQSIAELAEAALPAYVAGLRDAGWQGDERQVHAGYALSAIRWVFMFGPLSAVLDPARQQQVVTWARAPYAEVVARAGQRTALLLRLIESAS